jgi:hypothetical protein
MPFFAVCAPPPRFSTEWAPPVNKKSRERDIWSMGMSPNYVGNPVLWRCACFPAFGQPAKGEFA